MPYILYNLLLVPLYPLLAVYLAQRYLSGKSKPGWSERWGRYEPSVRRTTRDVPRIWLHAVSAGEVVAAAPILRELRARSPRAEIILSVITSAGFEMAGKQAAGFVDRVIYFPFDFPWVARRVVSELQPDVFVSMESDMWPNLLYHLRRSEAATALANGRITKANLQRVKRFGKLLFRWMIGNMDRCLMQTELDLTRIMEMAGPGGAARFRVVGNSKYDQAVSRPDAERKARLRAELHLPDHAPVLVAGSTRSRDEEAVLIAAYQKMRDKAPDLCLVIAPRKLDRTEELVTDMRAAGLEPVRRTQPDAAGTGARHIVLDTLGELVDVYALADIVFVGNSFAPVVDGGGQNLIQPLAQGKPVMVGPFTATCAAEIAMAVEAGAGFQVQTGEELAAVGTALLNNPRQLAVIEAHALKLVAVNQGASGRYAEEIIALLGVEHRG